MNKNIQTTKTISSIAWDGVVILILRFLLGSAKKLTGLSAHQCWFRTDQGKAIRCVTACDSPFPFIKASVLAIDSNSPLRFPPYFAKQSVPSVARALGNEASHNGQVLSMPCAHLVALRVNTVGPHPPPLSQGFWTLKQTTGNCKECLTLPQWAVSSWHTANTRPCQTADFGVESDQIDNNNLVSVAPFNLI